MARQLLFLIVILISLVSSGQNNREFLLKSIVFYNVENLFDTIDDPETADDPRTPLGKDKWSPERYSLKLDRIAGVLSEFNVQGKPMIPDVVGLCEVENRKVLEDIITHPKLIQYNYGMVHHNSPDSRGIDVCLLYRKSSFQPISFQSHRLLLFNEDEQREYTRDQLVVSGLLDTENIYFIVNHWPSRSGGEEKTKSFRIAAARLSRHIVDSICRVEESPKFVIMGDFNDNPIDHSIKNVLNTSGSQYEKEHTGFFNPMEDLYKIGIGSLAYRDQWNLFDQIIISRNLISEEKKSYSFWKAGVYMPDYLITLRGRFKGYPYRTYAGGSYQGGYSDHLPVYLLLIRDKD